ncbi:hypothetical protein BN2475_1030004 [Paraburkholderia ribeironis]|uniref:Uncharacterized protein n=1 Tax=Paraburkholderia ribeironis TaxID=1247936 RepID=A0A1N7SMA2_9BURK|nr:hypothetical protein BN2475_1030004 [Paraburkholderia ribeironis]
MKLEHAAKRSRSCFRRLHDQRKPTPITCAALCLEGNPLGTNRQEVMYAMRQDILALIMTRLINLSAVALRIQTAA